MKPELNQWKNKFQILFIIAIWEGENYKAYNGEPVLDLWQW